MKRQITAAVLMSMLAIACGKDAKPLVDAAEKYAKDSCACKDADCLTKAAEGYGEATKKFQGEKLEPSEDQAKAIIAATEKAVKCNTEVATKAASDAMKKAMPAAAPAK